MATTITANGINFPDGSAAAPSIGGTDTNTGLFTGSDIVGFATGGLERIRIDANGNLSLGTTSPNNYSNYTTFTINGTTGGQLDIESNGTKYGDIYTQSNAFHVRNKQASGSGFLAFHTTNSGTCSEKLRITSDGFIGVGTATVASILDVRDTSTTAYPFTSADSGTYSYTPYAHELNLRNNTTGTDDGFAGIHFHAGERSAGGRQGTARISALYTGEYKADLVFATRNTSFKERMRITAAGKVGIGTTSDAKGVFDIQSCGSDGVPTIAFGGNNSSSTGTTRTDGTDKAVRVGCVHQTNAEQPFAIFYAVAGASNHNTINYGGGTSWMNAATRHQFHTAANTTTTAGTNKMTIHQGGDVEIIDGNLKVASTHGIDFSATADSTGSNISMDSELLDDYERGTWGSINTGADSCTFSHNWYIKIGRVVTCNVRLSGITNGNGSALTLNLPFANGTVEASGSVACDTFNMPSDWVLMNSYAYDAKLYILASRDNAGWENLLGNMTANNSTIIMNITYLANS